jgi:hypothetical protein
MLALQIIRHEPILVLISRNSAIYIHTSTPSDSGPEINIAYNHKEFYLVLKMASLYSPQAANWTNKIRTLVGLSPYAEEENHIWLFNNTFIRFFFAISCSYIELVMVYRTFT